MKTINEINTNTKEGRLLMAALARLTVTTDRDKEPDKVLKIISEVSEAMYKDEPPVNSVAEAMKTFCLALINDKGYFMGWVANIAMAFKDAHSDFCEKNKSKKPDIHVIANRAADNFLNQIVGEELKKFPVKHFIKKADGSLEQIDGDLLIRLPDEIRDYEDNNAIDQAIKDHMNKKYGIDSNTNFVNPVNNQPNFPLGGIIVEKEGGEFRVPDKGGKIKWLAQCDEKEDEKGDFESPNSQIPNPL